MRLYHVYTRGLLTYPVPGTSPSGGVAEITGLAASCGDNGAPNGGLEGPAFVLWGAPCATKDGAFHYPHIFYLSVQSSSKGSANALKP